MKRPNCQKPDACEAKSKRHTHCRGCANLLRMTDPARREAILESVRKMNASPKQAETRSRNGKLYGSKNMSRGHTPEARTKAGRTHSMRMLNLPVEAVPIYRDLHNSGMSPEERRRAALEAVEHAARREVRAAQLAMERKAARQKREAY